MNTILNVDGCCGHPGSHRNCSPPSALKSEGHTLILSNEAVIFEKKFGREIIWGRGKKKGMPEIKEVKRKVRDVASSDNDLGHIENLYIKY